MGKWYPVNKKDRLKPVIFLFLNGTPSEKQLEPNSLRPP